MKHHILYSFLYTALLVAGGCDFTASDQENNSTVSTSKNLDLATLESWITNKVLIDTPLDKVNYQVGSADLNGDDEAEHFVLIQDQYFCGSGGCTAYLFDNSGNVITRMTVVNTPVLLTDDETNGWRDFIVWSNGEYRLMKYDGSAYPSNPSVQIVVKRDKEMEQAMTAVKKTELYQQDGYGIRQAESQKLWTSTNEYHFTFKHYGDPDSVYHATVDIKSGEMSVESQ